MLQGVLPQHCKQVKALADQLEEVYPLVLEARLLVLVDHHLLDLVSLLLVHRRQALDEVRRLVALLLDSLVKRHHFNLLPALVVETHHQDSVGR